MDGRCAIGALFQPVSGFIRLVSGGKRRMSIWSRLFGWAKPPRPDRGDWYIKAKRKLAKSKRKLATRPLLSDPSNKQVVYGSLARLEAAGLRISDALDRDLIVVRFLVGFGSNSEVDDLATSFAEKENEVSKNSLDLVVFWELSHETGDLYGFEDFRAMLPKLIGITDEELSDMLEQHSKPVFENVCKISIVNEELPGEYVRQQVQALVALVDGDFEVQSITETVQSGRIVGNVTLTNGDTSAFDLSAEKRPDLTNFFYMMNSLIEPTGKGRFIVAVCGSSEELVVIYLRPNEQMKFRSWAEQQYCAGDPEALGDWFE